MFTATFFNKSMKERKMREGGKEGREGGKKGEIKGKQIEKEKRKFSVLPGNMILYLENPKEFT